MSSSSSSDKAAAPSQVTHVKLIDDKVAEHLVECLEHLCESMRALSMRHGDAGMMYPNTKPEPDKLSEAELARLRAILNG